MKKLAVCGIKQDLPAKKLNTSKEVEKREIVGLRQRIVNLYAGKIRRNSDRARFAHDTDGFYDKIFYFVDVTVEERNNSVLVRFNDGHEEEFQSGELVVKYDTVNLSDYGPVCDGITKNMESGTTHLVGRDGYPVCGTNSVTKESNPDRFEPYEAKLPYVRPICGNCRNCYSEDFIDTMIQLRLAPNHI